MAGATFGITTTADLTPADVERYEALGIDGFWAGGHLATNHPTPEALTSLAWLAACSRQAVVGTSVLPLPLYPPVLVAKQVAEIDRRSGGRVVLGVGVGGEFPEEFAAAGVPVGERGARTDEAIGTIRSLWRGESLAGGGATNPLPARSGGPPIVVAGRRGAAMRRAAANDGWMPYLYSPERYRASVDAIGEQGPEFAWMLWLVVHVADDADDAVAQVARRLPGGPDPERTGRVAAAGTAADVRRRLRAYLDAGARHLILNVAPQDHRQQVERLCRDVLPDLRDPR